MTTPQDSSLEKWVEEFDADHLINSAHLSKCCGHVHDPKCPVIRARRILLDALARALTQAHQAGYADGYKQGKFDAEVTAEYGEPKALQDNK